MLVPCSEYGRIRIRICFQIRRQNINRVRIRNTVPVPVPGTVAITQSFKFDKFQYFVHNLLLMCKPVGIEHLIC